MKLTTYKQALDYLESFIGRIVFKVDPYSVKKHDPLERMRVLLSFLGNPQEKFKSILIGGTSGKGSTAYLISHILRTAGYKTGLTISPHLQKINERLQINNKEISDEEFVALLNSVLPAVKQMNGMPARNASASVAGGPSYFEILIAMAFLYFADEKVDIAVVEVGMGGEFDATNTLYPLICVLTNVSLDHTDMLGNTIEEIAKTKAGIIKFARGPVAPSSHPTSSVAGPLRSLDGTPSSRVTPRRDLTISSLASGQAPIVITGAKQSSVIKIVEEKRREAGAKAYRLGKDFSYKIKKESLKGSVFDFSNLTMKQFNNISLSLLGEHQIENASLAVEVILQLKKFGFKVPEKIIKHALQTAFFPGRFEVVKVHSRPKFMVHGIYNQLLTINHQLLVLDGAHNPTKMHAFLSSLNRLFPGERKIFVVAFKNDKDIGKMLTQIAKVADTIIATEFHAKTDMKRNASANAESIKYEVLSIKYGGKVYAERDSRKALNKAVNLLAIEQYSNRTMIIVTGSLYLVGEIRSML